MVAEIYFTEEELNTGVAAEGKLESAFNAYTEDGCIQLNNVFSPRYIQSLHDSYIKKYNRYFKGKDFNDALTVGNKRIMVSVKMETPFNASKLYANPLVYPLMKALLGSEFIINGFGSVISLPGAMDQNPHYDHPPLFKMDDVDTKTPSYCITMIVPLVELNEKTGTTALMTGSHRFPALNVDYGLPYEYCKVPIGSCLLMDYKLRHYGVANRSDAVRPILYNIYSRPWFRDYKNYGKQTDLEISRKDYSRIPDEYKHLFLFAARN